MLKRLITSALPYVNNIPHLGNLIQVLSADVFARFSRQAAYETLYICGTDEYGTATETRAQLEGVTAQELCDRYFQIHAEIYRWFNISFDRFGRTSTPEQTEIVQHLFKKMRDNGYIQERQVEQIYCRSCERFLADRFLYGRCPYCESENARGDQCEDCGKLLSPTDLKEPRCSSCHQPPESRSSRQLFVELDRLAQQLDHWLPDKQQFWSANAWQITQSWLKEGLQQRCITRDLSWGVSVPHPGFENKVFYVWFDAPIGYISITARHTKEWKSWWQNPEKVELTHFIGKDNVPFHSILFPATLLASGEAWTTVKTISASEYLNYENGKFSKTRGVGLFGDDCMHSGIEADIWRFYIFYNRPEKGDYRFSWSDFQLTINGELIGNIANLVNRTLSFCRKFFDSKVEKLTEVDPHLTELLKNKVQAVTAALEKCALREALRQICSLASEANRYFQHSEPWVLIKSDPRRCHQIISTLCYILKDLSILLRPYLPSTSDRLASFLAHNDFSWSSLGHFQGLERIQDFSPLFTLLSDEQIAILKDRYSGKKELTTKATQIPIHTLDQQKKALNVEELLRHKLALVVAEITKVEPHPKADRLYLEEVDAGTLGKRQIISGLAEHYSPEELVGRRIILMANLKPLKLRGETSQGMLLAAKDKDELELIESQAPLGSRVLVASDEEQEVTALANLATFKSKDLENLEFASSNGSLLLNGAALSVENQPLTTQRLLNAPVS